MRTVFTVIALCLAWLVAYQPSYPDEKEEKERRELEKQLAEMEPTLEKEEWAIKRKQFIAEMTKYLDKADHIDVFRLNPRALPEGNKGEKKEFYGYEILSEARIEPKEQRKEVAAFLGRTLHWNELRKAFCFNPRHGLRAISGKKSLDFLICFECNRVRIFDGGEQLAELPMGFTDQKNPIKRFIADHEKKAKVRK